MTPSPLPHWRKRLAERFHDEERQSVGVAEHEGQKNGSPHGWDFPPRKEMQDRASNEGRYEKDWEREQQRNEDVLQGAVRMHRAVCCAENGRENERGDEQGIEGCESG